MSLASLASLARGCSGMPFRCGHVAGFVYIAGSRSGPLSPSLSDSAGVSAYDRHVQTLMSRSLRLRVQMHNLHCLPPSLPKLADVSACGPRVFSLELAVGT
jgi:hypothetical protein